MGQMKYCKTADDYRKERKEKREIGEHLLLLRLWCAAAINYFSGESGSFYGKQQQYSLFLLH
jgi:hypothetical protein